MKQAEADFDRALRSYGRSFTDLVGAAAAFRALIAAYPDTVPARRAAAVRADIEAAKKR